MSDARSANDTEDRELLQRWREGDERAGATLVKRYFGLVHRFFRNKVSSPEDATDLVSETMLACTRSKERITGSSFRSYLFAVATNTLRLHIRKRAKRQRELDDFSEICVAETQGAASPTRMMAQRQETQLLARALRRIPIENQIVLELGFFEGLTAPQIAELLEIPVATVYSRQRRGKSRLEAMVAELSEDPSLAQSTMMGLQTWALQIKEQLPSGRAP